ncbi:MARVEL domain-containing protein 1 isoform X2 [Alligator mississippiensis]|uniref:MARVEL domain-containing protein 1 n=1 Tax=Alligator mississippiensis TaxID=8496 RepID=A0A151ML16_ALLMI|nr:MARVEL domain-containing protein 1 isoform X2 [Alligator mississippiensis]KYO25218.1 MARVEL domain-containing protein 1 [Alligator mississippiensis]
MAGTGAAGAPPPAPRAGLSLHRPFVCSPLGPLRLGQLVLGAAFWVTVAAHKYEGAAHFALFAAVLVWLLTLALLGLSLLGRWALVPVLGARWLLTNLLHDLVLGTGLYAAAAGIMGHKAKRYSYCNVPGYSQPCLHRAYLSAAVCGGIAAGLYLLSGLWCLARRCRGHRDIV